MTKDGPMILHSQLRRRGYSQTPEGTPQDAGIATGLCSLPFEAGWGDQEFSLMFATALD
jgi:hypothetical protein